MRAKSQSEPGMVKTRHGWTARWGGALLAALFAFGMVILPVGHLSAAGHDSCAHSGHCSHAPASPDDSSTETTHDPATCTICKLAHVPVWAAAPAYAPVPGTGWIAPVALAPESPAVSPDVLLPFSCGPPA